MEGTTAETDRVNVINVGVLGWQSDCSNAIEVSAAAIGCIWRVSSNYLRSCWTLNL